MIKLLQYCLPQLFISRLVGVVANCQQSVIKNLFIKLFIKHFKVDLNDAQRTDYRQYKSFNDFFTRALKPEARPLPLAANQLISPVDGFISQHGKINDRTILQAKGKDYSLIDLLAGDKTLAEPFRFGDFLTAYLAPANYHCFHMPITGRLTQMIYVPGKLFSVNQSSVDHVDGLFARNERVICLFDTEIGPFAFIAVGALLVGSIAVEWHGIVNPKHKNVIKRFNYQHAPQSVTLERGAKLGHFQMGSTVILLLPPKKIEWQHDFIPNQPLRFGQALAKLSS